MCGYTRLWWDAFYDLNDHTSIQKDPGHHARVFTHYFLLISSDLRHPLIRVPPPIRAAVAVIGAEAAEGLFRCHVQRVAAQGAKPAAGDLPGAVDLAAEPVVGFGHLFHAHVLGLEGDVGGVVVAPRQIK
jgi:hypothetical protein